MPSEYYFGYYFYAPGGRFEPCGMFTASHIIATAVCIALVVFALFITAKKQIDTTKDAFIRISAVVLTVLEIIKISHSFIYGDLHLDAWFPLSYCGLFIFALWMFGYGKSKIKKAGEAFIAYGCPIAGIAFLIFPTTSLMSYPIGHFFSIYSLLFHSLMIFLGISFLSKEKRLELNTYSNYIWFVILFSVIAIIMNSCFGCNLMNLREPYNIPIQFLQMIYSEANIGYTLLVLSSYVIIPPLIAALSGKLKHKK